MPLSTDECDFLDRVLPLALSAMQHLNSWERGFVADVAERYDEHGSDMFMSKKQWGALHEIENKL